MAIIDAIKRNWKRYQQKRQYKQHERLYEKYNSRLQALVYLLVCADYGQHSRDWVFDISTALYGMRTRLRLYELDSLEANERVCPDFATRRRIERFLLMRFEPHPTASGSIENILLLRNHVLGYCRIQDDHEAQQYLQQLIKHAMRIITNDKVR